MVSKLCQSVVAGFGILLSLACGDPGPTDLEGVDDVEYGTVSEAVISSSAVEALIAYGRTDIGGSGGLCKPWVSAKVLGSYQQTLPATDASPASDQYKWVNDTTPATNVARWLGSYANGRLGPVSLASGASTTLSVAVPNGDPQTIVLYANTASVSAALAKSGSPTLSVSSSGGVSGTVATSTTSGSGTWTLTVTNTGGSSASGIVAVVLSKSRFQSDWQTARRGDIMQMYVGTSGTNRSIGGPHTTFVQTYQNANMTCTVSDTTGCNWLDSNWVDSLKVGAHNISMNDMLKMSAYSSLYGFTVYRLN